MYSWVSDRLPGWTTWPRRSLGSGRRTLASVGCSASMSELPIPTPWRGRRPPFGGRIYVADRRVVARRRQAGPARIAVRHTVGCVRDPMGERLDREGGMVAGDTGRVVAPTVSAGLPAADRRGVQGTSSGSRDDRHLPAAARRRLHHAGVRLRQGNLGTGRARVSGRLPGQRDTRRAGTLTLGQWRPRVGLLRERSRRDRCPVTRCGPAPPGDVDESGAGSQQLRPVLPVAGLPAQDWVREPDRPAPPRRVRRSAATPCSSIQTWNRGRTNGRSSRRSLVCFARCGDGSRPIPPSGRCRTCVEPRGARPYRGGPAPPP